MALNSSLIKTIIFDLDDTLFDTNGQLVKPAAHEACEAMLKAGLKGQSRDVLSVCDKYLEERDRIDLFTKLVQFFGCKSGVNAKHVIETGFNAFHHREIKEKIILFPGTAQLLIQLKNRYDLYLVTLGGLQTQKKKVSLLKIASFFKEVFFVDVTLEKTKVSAFKNILNLYPNLNPSNFLSIGNRIDSEIKDAKSLGMQTVLVAHGEYASLKPQHPSEEPDANVETVLVLSDLL